MSVLGTLAVNLLAKTTGFDTGMGKSRRKVTAFRKDINKLSGSLKRMGGIALGAVGVAGLGAFTKKNLETLDALGKTADKLGIATEDLGAFQYAAELSGVETAKLNKGIQDMSRRVSDAAFGTGEARMALEQLNLKATDLRKLNPADQFRKIGAALAQIDNASDKVALATDIFGRDGPAFLNVFAAGLSDVEAEYKKLGLAVTREQITNAEKFNDAMTKLTAVVGRLGQKFTIEIAPQATAFVDKLTTFIANWQQSGLGKSLNAIGRFFETESNAQNGLFREREDKLFGGTTSGSLIIDWWRGNGLAEKLARNNNNSGFRPAPASQVGRTVDGMDVWAPKIFQTLNQIYIEGVRDLPNTFPQLVPSSIQ